LTSLTRRHNQRSITGIDIRTTNQHGAIFNALPFVQSSGLLNNTLNIGDSITDNAGDGTLNYITANNGFAANPPFAFDVTLTGVEFLNISNESPHQVAGFQGTVTGLTTVTDTNSINTVKLGGFNQGLNTPLTSVTIKGYGGANGSLVFEGIIAAAAGATTNSIAITTTGPLGSTKAFKADKLEFTADSGPGVAGSPNVSYGTWSITSNSNNDLQLQQGGVGAATTLNLAGKGNIAVGQDAAGNWQALTTINASGESGTVIITGASSGFGTGNAFATAANPGWLFGSHAGLLDDTGTGGVFNLTSFVLGSGTNILDVSSASAAQVGLLTTSGAAGPNNEIIVNDGVATTTSTATFAHISGFEILGVTGAGGTINMANLPGSITEILYQTAAAGPVSIVNQVNPLTVNVEDNGGGFALSSTGAGFTDSFTLDLGNSLHNTVALGGGAGAVGPLTLTADSIVNINALGQTTTGPLITDTVGFVSLTPSIAGNEAVTIGANSNTALIVGDATGAIGDFNPITGALNPFNLFLTDDSHATVTLLGGTTGVLQGYSTNAFSIDAHAATGALVMEGGDANFNPGATVALSIGDTITGAAATGNILIGSLGNDTFVSKGSGDIIATDGGADSIALSGGGDTIDLFAAVAPGGVVSHTANLGGVLGAGDIVNSGDVASAGWWGQGAGQGSVSLPTLATSTGFGISTDLSIVSGAANAAGGTNDVIDFSVGAWSHYLANTSGVQAGAGAAIFTNPVAPGGAITTAGANVIDIGVGTYDGAAALANQIAGLGINLATGGTILAGHDYHFLVAYQNSANGGGATIADLDVVALTTSTHINGTNDHIAVSDMVQLTGVNVAALTAANIHLLA
jgi:hypothetical protein